MILQNILFPSTKTCTEESMYFRREGKIKYGWSNDCITLGKYATASFDTYFNSFSIEKWAKYTVVKDLQLNLVIQGNVRITLMRKERALNGEVIVSFTDEYEFNEEEPTEVSCKFDTESDMGMLCFQVFGLDKKSYIYGGSYSSDINPADVRKVKIALDICTYRREKFITRNIALLNKCFLENENSYLYDKLEIFVSDNAKTLDAEKLGSSKVHIFGNKNVGGAGGFTRGMIEVKAANTDNSITHVLVMDDDVCVEPESIFRTCILLSLLKEQYANAFVGGAMLRLDRRYEQVESGAMWNAGELVSLKGGLDLRNLEACLFNEFDEGAQFNAWWYCVIPIGIIRDDNLPLPIFIRGDDVEYGLRNMKHMILMNGICVWHEAFENKYSSFTYYYILRNRFIDNAIHNMAMDVSSVKNLVYRWVMDEVKLYRYKNANLIMKGVEDYLKGVDWLAAQDGEKFHQEIMSEGYKMQYIDDLKDEVQFLFPLYEASFKDVPRTKFVDRIVNKLTVNGTYLKPKNAYKIVPVVGTQQSSIYRTNKVLNFDYSSKKGFVTYRNVNELKACEKRLKALYKNIEDNYERVSKEYEEQHTKLTTLDFWNGYLA